MECPFSQNKREARNLLWMGGGAQKKHILVSWFYYYGEGETNKDVNHRIKADG